MDACSAGIFKALGRMRRELFTHKHQDEGLCMDTRNWLFNAVDSIAGRPDTSLVLLHTPHGVFLGTHRAGIHLVRQTKSREALRPIESAGKDVPTKTKVESWGRLADTDL